MAPRPILITGACGFLGRALLRRLSEEPRPLLLLTRRGGRARTIEAARAAGAAGMRVQVAEVAWDDPASVRKAVAGAAPALAFHLAGGRSAGGGDPAAACEAANVQPLRALLAALEEAPPDAMIFASSGEVYGAQPAPFTEDQQPCPISPYGDSKASAEAEGIAAWRRRGMPFVSARLGVVYGPGQAGDMFIPQLLRSALQGEPFAMTPGAQRRDFLFVDDAVAGLVALSRVPAAAGAAVNLGSGRSATILEVAERLLDLLGHPISLQVGALPYREAEIMDYRLSVDRMAEWTGWAARVSLEEGLRLTVQGTRESTPR